MSHFFYVSFLDVNNWLVQIETHSLFDNPDVVLCGNKSDMEERRVVKKRDVLALAERYAFSSWRHANAVNSNVLHQAPPRLLRDIGVHWSRPQQQRRATGANGHEENGGGNGERFRAEEVSANQPRSADVSQNVTSFSENDLSTLKTSTSRADTVSRTPKTGQPAGASAAHADGSRTVVVEHCQDRATRSSDVWS